MGEKVQKSEPAVKKQRTEAQVLEVRVKRKEQRDKKKAKRDSDRIEKRKTGRYDKNVKIRSKKKEKHEEVMKNAGETLKRTVFVGRLAPSVTAESLKKHMSKYGTIEDLRFLWKDDEKTIHKGCAYIQYKEIAQAEKSCKADGSLLDEKPIRVNLESQKDIKSKNETTVYVKGLSFDTDETSIKKMLASCGKISRISVPVFEDTGKRRGYAFVDFDTKDAVEKALKLTDSEWDGRKVTITTHQSKTN